MKKTIWLIIVLAAMVLGAVSVSASTLKDSYNPSGLDSGSATWVNTEYRAQLFTASSTYQLDSIKLYGGKNGLPGMIDIEIRATSGGNPTSTVLASTEYNGNTLTQGSSAYYESFFSSPAVLQSGTTYAIVYHIRNYGDTGNYYLFGYKYPGGSSPYELKSTNSGSSWAVELSGLTNPYMLYGSDPFVEGCLNSICKVPSDTQIINTDPTITQAQTNAVYTLTAGMDTNATYWFIANDVNGVDDLDDITAYFNCAGCTPNGLDSLSCTPTDINATAANYSCLIEFPYYTAKGGMDVDMGIQDVNLGSISYQGTGSNSNAITINTLDAIEYDAPVSWSGALTSGSGWIEGNMLTFTNKGNNPYSSNYITGYETAYNGYKIYAENYEFTTSTGTCSGENYALHNDTPVNMGPLQLPTEGGLGEGVAYVFPCVSVPAGLPSGTYNSVANWIFAFNE